MNRSLNSLITKFLWENGGLTPLLDKNGKPVITPPNEIID